MIWRPVLLLGAACAASLLATLHFGDEVVIALGLIAVQVKILSQKVIALKPPAMLAWIKQHGATFLRKDLPYKYVSSVVLPMAVGKRLLRKISGIVARVLDPVRRQHARLRAWYADQPPVGRACLAAALFVMTVAMTVSTIGLWLILFSVSLPLWVGATLLTLGRMMLRSGEKYVFKMIAFLQLRWLWRGLRRLLPDGWLRRQRRLNFRLARTVARRRRLTARTMAGQKDRLSYRLALMAEILRSRFR